MASDLWSPLRVLDGSFKARHNAERALREAVAQRYEQQIVIKQFEREYAARMARAARASSNAVGLG
jgi:hypothetical protein